VTDAALASRYQFGGQDIAWQLEHWARHRGEHRFLVWEPKSGRDRSWSYAQFWHEVQRVAAGLAARGIGVRDRVLLHSDNCPEMVIAWYACATVGATAVTTNTGSVADELAHATRHAGVRAAITQPKYARLVAENAGPLDWLAVTPANSDGERDGDDAGGDAFEALYRDAQDAPRRAPEPLLPAGILYTSGTTSRPKAVVHTHANFLWAGRIGPYVMDFGPDDTHFAQLPFFHTNAQLWATATAIGAGGSVLLLPQPTVSRFWELVEKHRVTHMTATAYLQKSLANGPIEMKQHRMKIVQGSLGPGLRALAQRAGAEPIAAYGMSETVIYTIHTDARRVWPDYALGRPAPGYEAKVMDEEGETLAAVDAPGELWIRAARGIQLFLEYYDNPQANASAFTADGWFRTGDIVKLGADGNLYYLDRDKDRLRVGGENVSASEVEGVVLQVAGVAETAVVARSDSRLDMVPVAFVIRAANAPAEAALRAAVLARCAERLSPFKRPREVFFVDEFPRAVLGKVAKNRLRELAETLEVPNA
jgi:crotonobetaine/carnitine-CoA ligase